jgi:hypothetical protein
MITETNRISWLNEVWDLLDLQVNLRTKDVQSSMPEQGGGLRLRADEDFRLAVFFVVNNEVVSLDSQGEVDWVKVSLRDAGNVEEVLHIDAASSETQEGFDYYLFQPEVTNLAEIAREMVFQPKAGAGNVAACVGEVEWSIGGKIYSSKSFPVYIEVGLTLQQAASRPVRPVMPPPATPPPVTPPPVTPPPVTPPPPPDQLPITEDLVDDLKDFLDGLATYDLTICTAQGARVVKVYRPRV